MVEGGTDTAKISKGSIIVVSRGALLPPYIKEQGGGSGRPRRGRTMGSPTPTGSRIPPFQVVGVGEKEGEERREGRRGCGPSP